MSKRLIKYLCVITVVIGILFLSNNYIKVKADSGWDTDFDSGGSWDSGSDWGSSSDWGGSSDWDSDYSSGGGSSTDGFIAFVIICIVIFAIISSAKSKNTGSSNNSTSYRYNQLNQDQVNQVIPNFNIEEFNFNAYKIFYDVQMGWMNFDYDKLKELLTDELYNSYVMDLDVLKMKNQRNTMNGFELIDTKLISLKETNDKYEAKVLVNVKFYDYIEDMNTNKLVRGTNGRKVNNTYILTFIRTKEEKADINKCPRCGAPVEGNTTGICEYCKSKLINETYDWVMSKKEKISQR